MKTCPTQYSTAKTFFSRVSQFSGRTLYFCVPLSQVLEREKVTLVQVMLNNYYFNFRSVGPYFPTIDRGWGLTHLIHLIAQFGARTESCCYGAR